MNRFDLFLATGLTAMIPLLHPECVAQEIVYDNSSTYQNQFATQSLEYGDEITLEGTARIVTDFYFEYFGNFTSNGDEMARIRFYANDGVVLSQYYTTPGTVLFESGFFPLHKGASTRHLQGLSVTVPNRFTWTIEIRGLSMLANDQAGLLFYNPVDMGQSHDDFWRKEAGGNWLPFGTGNVFDNFAARVIAVAQPPRIESVTPTANGAKLMVRVIPGRSYGLEHRSVLGIGGWQRLRLNVAATGTTMELTHTGANSGDTAHFYRVVDVFTPVTTSLNQPVIPRNVIGRTEIHEQ